MCDLHETLNAADGEMPTLHRRDVVRGLWSGTMVAYAGAAAGCTTNPATGRSQLIMFSEGELVQMASQAWAQTKQETPISRDRAANARLQRIGKKIAANATARSPQLQGTQWEFVVFDTDDKNAFVLPGGKVGFYKGLMDFSENDDQMAAVLGHEVGHVTGRHSSERMSQQMLGQVGMVAAGVAAASSDLSTEQQQLLLALGGAGLTMGVILPYSRKHELEADLLGVDYMYDSGYDVTESVRLWERMGGENRSSTPEWMSTHPSPNTRVRELKSYINSRGYALMA